ncbi:D-2-hydroxyacid dehydrogenase [Pseudoprimorskyibacter insulae]|uniref:Glyoxylate/hydroxypyruvate reductase A n=1 Tax=Pseudoprimorskyibacter insulae TaxID=1695997 RepID=A0A2R8AQY1_9RHOB|nr:D-2-hydroxyacid dehydrogenase [Pseudoprimorskyibacter insulae]SPF78481.1 Glyoxylate/hydroxypyruvate reductase A [Pseudoprimorskyibacter insulae]
MSILIFDSEAAFYARHITAAHPDLTIRTATTEDEALAHAADTTAIIGLAPYLSPRLLDAAPGLEWVQALTTGVDNLLGRKGLAITNCRGIHGPQMTELALMLTLACLRDLPGTLANQAAHVWQRKPQSLLSGKTVCVLGLGAIAEHMAGVLKAMGVRLTGVSGGRTEAPGFDKIYARADLAQAAAEADILIVLTPYSAATHHIVDAEVLAAMKPSAYLVNIARGGCVDEDALADALRSGSIAGAALDVFARSPLKPDDPVWDLPNLIITPHIGGFADVYHEQALPILQAHVAEYARGGVAALTERLDT